MIDRFEDDVEFEGSVPYARPRLEDLVVVGRMFGVFGDVGLDGEVEVSEIFDDPFEDLRREGGQEEGRKVSFERFGFRRSFLRGLLSAQPTTLL